MTRETKVGLVVAGSFICLVAIVVASKFRAGDASSTPTADAAEELAQAQEKERLDQRNNTPKPAVPADAGPGAGAIATDQKDTKPNWAVPDPPAPVTSPPFGGATASSSTDPTPSDKPESPEAVQRRMLAKLKKQSQL